MDPNIHGDAINGFVVRRATGGGDEEATPAQVNQKLAGSSDGTTVPFVNKLKIANQMDNGWYSMVYLNGTIPVTELYDFDGNLRGSMSFDVGEVGLGVTVNADNLTGNREYFWPDSAGTLPTTASGIVAPATTPTAVGMFYVDTVAKKLYVSTGTASSADWTILN